MLSLLGIIMGFMARRIIIWLAIAVVVVFLAFFGMWLDFNESQHAIINWLINDQELKEGFLWIAENTASDARVLVWWDYADGVVEIGHRDVVIREASREIKWTIAGMHKYPWSWIAYELWYPFESEEKVRDVGRFFIAENSSAAIDIARKYGADYVFVVYPDDVMKFYAIVMATGKQPSEYLGETEATTREEMVKVVEQRAIIKKETIGMRLIYGDKTEGFEKVFDNERVRIYKIIE